MWGFISHTAPEHFRPLHLWLFLFVCMLRCLLNWGLRPGSPILEVTLLMSGLLAHSVFHDLSQEILISEWKFYNSEQGIGYSFFTSVIFEEILLKYLGFKRLKSKTSLCVWGFFVCFVIFLSIQTSSGVKSFLVINMEAFVSIFKLVSSALFWPFLNICVPMLKRENRHKFTFYASVASVVILFSVRRVAPSIFSVP